MIRQILQVEGLPKYLATSLDWTGDGIRRLNSKGATNNVSATDSREAIAREIES